jgi:hypothetical protein
MKKHNAIVILGFAMILINASCSKESSMAEAKNNAGIQRAANLSDANEIFSLSRSGEIVTITVKIDFVPCKQVELLRNTTGVPIRRSIAARVNPDVLVFRDILPDAKPYWYWLQVVPIKGELQFFGPIRVGADAGNTGKYVDVAKIYKWTLARTDAKATFAWSFPSDDFKSMELLRKTNINDYSKRKSVFMTRESAGDTVDHLTDPDADYWYWIETTLGDGRVITQGPVKAEFSTE